MGDSILSLVAVFSRRQFVGGGLRENLAKQSGCFDAPFYSLVEMKMQDRRIPSLHAFRNFGLQESRADSKPRKESRAVFSSPMTET